MTIRVTCAQCGAALKIKDELAGTEGHCPKCKTKFRVPELARAGTAEPQPAEAHAAPSSPTDHAPLPHIAPPAVAAAPATATAPVPDTGPVTADDRVSAAAPVKDTVPAAATAAAPSAGNALPAVDDELDCEPALLWNLESQTASAPSTPVAKKAAVAPPVLPSVPPATPDKQPAAVREQPPVAVAEATPPLAADPLPAADAEPVRRPVAGSPPRVSADDLSEAPRLALPQDDGPSAGPLSDAEVDAPLLTLQDDEDEASAPVALRLPETDAETRPKEPDARPKGKPKKKAGARNSVDEDFDPADFLSSAPPQTTRARPSSQEILTDIGGSEWDADRPPRDSAKKPAKSSATTAAAATEVWDHAKAARQMQRALKESVSQAEQQRKPEEEERFDWVGFLREFGVKGLGGILACVVLAYGAYWTFDRMLGRGVPLPEMGYVSGVVTLDGNPLPGATVYFMPTEPKYPNGKKGTARTSVGITDQQGRYTMLYIENIQGVATGNCMVWLDLIGPDGKQVIPPDYLQGSMKMFEVKPGRQTFDFALQSRGPLPRK